MTEQRHSLVARLMTEYSGPAKATIEWVWQ
jgi:hypothetical protein